MTKEIDSTELFCLSVGDTIQRGDLFIVEGKQYEVDKRGTVLGVTLKGSRIEKSGTFFRKNAESNGSSVASDGSKNGEE